MISTSSGWLSFFVVSDVFTSFHSRASRRKGHPPAEAFPSEKAQLGRRFCGATLWSVGSLLSLLGLSPWSIFKLKLGQGIVRIVGSQGYSFLGGQTSSVKVCITRIVGVASRRCLSELNRKWPKAGCPFSFSLLERTSSNHQKHIRFSALS